MITLEVTCPEGVVEGDLLAVERPGDGASFEVPLPAGVESGGAFLVELPEEAPPAEPSGAAVPAPSGLAAIAAGLACVRANAAQRQGREPRAVEGGEVLEAALRRILRELEDMEALDEMIEAHCKSFEEWTPKGEQRLEWTALHREFVALVEAGIASALEQMQCSAEDVFGYAQKYGGGASAAADGQLWPLKVDRLLSKLMATSDYSVFCEMMRDVAACGGMGV